LPQRQSSTTLHTVVALLSLSLCVPLSLLLVYLLFFLSFSLDSFLGSMGFRDKHNST
jgi:hypothetical protein